MMKHVRYRFSPILLGGALGVIQSTFQTEYSPSRAKS
jgi:hypothetical protein